MSRFFKPYEGKRPFLFVSYAHKDSEAVVDTIRILHDWGYRVWYDEGIPAGSDWPICIANHMRDCAGVLFFVSALSLDSGPCFSEMTHASDSRKPILIIPLDGTEPQEKWESVLKSAKTTDLSTNPEGRAKAILESGFVTRNYREGILGKIPWRALGLAASAVFFLLSLGLMIALSRGLLTLQPAAPEQPVAMEETVTDTQASVPEDVPEDPVEEEDLRFPTDMEAIFPVTFPDRQQERAIRRVLGISEEKNVLRRDLAEVRELYFCGNLIMQDAEGITFDADGNCYANSAPVVEGQISDLSLISGMMFLTRLSLVYQPLEDVSGLKGHVLLEELNLAGSTVTDISELQLLPSLKVLRLEHTGVKDLTSLSDLPALRTVTVSREMLPLTWSADADFDVVLVE